MCGIAGFLVTRGADALVPHLQSMVRLLHHRGPDSCGTHVAGGFACVHTRLSIVDLSAAGRQPFVDDRYVLAYNGEIYNHLELREAIKDTHPAPRGSSDTATLFALLRALGVEETLRRIRGMFAFSWYDTLEKRVWLCRDRFGIKPLVWCTTHDGMFWSSEAKALSPLMRLDVDPVQALFGLIGSADRSLQRTAFRDVRQLPPGHYVTYRLGEDWQLREYFNTRDLVDRSYYAELDRMPRTTVVRHFRGLLEESTRGMLMGDVPMGAFVSGGIDSGLIATLASKHQEDFSLFTADVVGPDSELTGATALAGELRRELHVSRFEPDQMLADWASATWFYELPITTHTNAIPFAGVARVARVADVKAILSGEGSDELFLGYPPLLMRRLNAAVRLPLAFVDALYGLVPKLKKQLLAGDSRELFLGRLARGFEQQLLRESNRSVFDFLPKAAGDEQYLTMEMFGQHLLTLLHRNDRMGMSASVEARFPFLDERVASFGFNLPARHKIRRTWRFANYKHPFLEDKSIVRAVARQVLPDSRARTPKLGFPMQGHTHVSVQPGFFRGGYVDDLVGLGHTREDYMLRKQPPYFIAKLASVEVFGRLFAMGHSVTEVTDHLRRHVKMREVGRPATSASSR
jgi:asparagine synthase (glutamine-hydrolysing)